MRLGDVQEQHALDIALETSRRTSRASGGRGRGKGSGGGRGRGGRGRAKAASPLAAVSAAPSAAAAVNVSTVAVPAVSTAEASAAAARRRRLSRRDSEDKVERCIQDRLKEFPAEVIEGARDSKGRSVRDYLNLFATPVWNQNRRLSSKFWVEFFGNFKLVCAPSENLVAPDVLEEVDDELLVALGFRVYFKGLLGFGA